MKKLHYLLSLCLVSTSLAEPPSAKDALAAALYTEEVTRDPGAAASQYLSIVEAYRSRRAHAATALFRLSEIRRNQNRKDEAIALYQEFLTSFPDFQPQSKLARESLSALGAPTAAPATDALEIKELARLTKLLKTAPDIITHPDTLEKAVKNNQLQVIDFLLENGSKPWRSDDSIIQAVKSGYLEVVKRLIKHDPKVPTDVAYDAVWKAYVNGRLILLTYLLDQGFPILANEDSPCLLMAACVKNDRALVDDLLARGAKINRTIPGSSRFPLHESHSRLLCSPLHTAIYANHIDLALHLLKKGASATLQAQHYHRSEFLYDDPFNIEGMIYPLHIAAISGADRAPELIKTLLDAGADHSIAGKWNENTASQVFPLPDGTPLEMAIALGLAENAKVLLDAGASPTPSDLQAASDSLPLFEILLSAGADPNAEIKSRGKEGPTLPVFKSIYQNFSRKLTARHIDLLIEHGAILDPRWVIEEIVPQKESEVRSSILGHFDKNPDYKYLSSCSIELMGHWGMSKIQQPGSTLQRRKLVFPAAITTTKFAEQDEQIFVNMLFGTDLLKISCYAATPGEAEARAKAFLAKLTEWQTTHLKKLTSTTDPATGVKPTAEEVIEGGKFWALQEAPQLPKDKITWK